MLKRVGQSVLQRRLFQNSFQPTFKRLLVKSFSSEISNADGHGNCNPHFNRSNAVHPLLSDEENQKRKKEWINPTLNHVWTEEELNKKLSETIKHIPDTMGEKIIWGGVRFAYYTFNFLTGYQKENPTTKSMEYRLIILESVAGVPGMIAAGMRHFKSLRTLQRDHGWIHTLLEEAENERMHLLVFMTMFKPSLLTRGTVILGQGVMVTFLSLLYLIKPQFLHRFVGYLEETAVDTYVDVINHMDTEGSHLNKDWNSLDAPIIAKNYWKLDENASFKDVVRCIAADECHHRDVNHTFASLDPSENNPYVTRHLKDGIDTWKILQQSSKTI